MVDLWDKAFAPASHPRESGEPTRAGLPSDTCPPGSGQPPVGVAASADVPQQLPAATRGFAGRSIELQKLTVLLDDIASAGTMVISAVDGMPGIGKTALAVHWAHQVADRFPDGQLYINLRGFDPSGLPVPAVEAIRRNQLTGLIAEGAHPLTLGLPTGAEAHQLLERRLGPDRLNAEPAPARQMADLCGRLPLALSIVAARAVTHPHFSLTDLAAELRNSQERLDAFEGGDPAANPRAVFSWSYQQLSTAAARMFRTFGMYPGPDITVPTAASMAGVLLPAPDRL